MQCPKPQSKSSEAREPYPKSYPRAIPRTIPAIHTPYTNLPARPRQKNTYPYGSSELGWYGYLFQQYVWASWPLSSHCSALLFISHVCISVSRAFMCASFCLCSHLPSLGEFTLRTKRAYQGCRPYFMKIPLRSHGPGPPKPLPWVTDSRPNHAKVRVFLPSGWEPRTGRRWFLVFLFGSRCTSSCSICRIQGFSAMACLQLLFTWFSASRAWHLSHSSCHSPGSLRPFGSLLAPTKHAFSVQNLFGDLRKMIHKKNKTNK